MSPDAIRNTHAETDERGSGLHEVVRTLRYLFFALRILIVVTIAWVLFGGIFTVREHEEAMVFRFGRLLSKEMPDGTRREVLTSGRLYWAWPYPIDVVKKIPTDRPTEVVSSHFWPQRIGADLGGLQDEAPPEGPDGGLRPGEDGYLLTGDANIMHTIWSVTYRVTDPKKYYLHFYHETDEAMAFDSARDEVESAARRLVRSTLENAVLKEVARWPIEDVLVTSRARLPVDQADALHAARESLRDAVRERIIQQIARYDMGISIRDVNLTDPQPPAATAAAFRRVNDAAQEYATLLEDAREYERRVVTEASGTSAEILARAEGYKTRVVASVQADGSYFAKVLSEYERNPRTMLVALYSDTIRDVLSLVDERYVIHTRSDGNQEIRLLLNPEPEMRSTTDGTAGHRD